MESVLPTQPIHDLATATDGEGAFRLEHVPAGRYTLTARAPSTPPLHVRDVEVLEGWPPRPRPARAAAGRRDLRQCARRRRRAERRGARHGAGARPAEQAVTDAAGAFRLPSLPAGEYQLRATPPTMWEALRYEAQTQVTLQAGQETPVLLSFVERAVAPH
jgi:hypothetical protein